MVRGLPSVTSVTGLNIKSSELVVATTSFPAPSGSAVVVIGNEIVVDLVSSVFVSLTLCSSLCSDTATSGSTASAASVLDSARGALVWVEVEMMEYWGALDTVVTWLADTTGATKGTICSRELRGWPGPKTEMRGRDNLAGA